MALKIIEVRLRFIAVLIATGLVIGYWDTIKNYVEKWTRRAVTVNVLEDSTTEFYCPMHPNVVRPGTEPGGEIPKCPICGMKLSLRTKGDTTALPDGVLSRLQLSPERIRLAGIQTVPVTYQPLIKEIRTVGYVGYDESRLARIVTRVTGYLEKLYVDRTWIAVQEGEPLADIYSPDLYSAANELLLALQSRSEPLIRSGRERLRLLGVGDSEIDHIIRSGETSHLLAIRSPRSGHVIRKQVVQGDHVEAGAMLFEVADLSVVWVEAEVFEKDIPFLKVGQDVEATVEGVPNRVFAGKVSLVHPHLEPMTRTNAVRIELENSEHALRPGMFANVLVKVPLREIEPFKRLASQAPLSSTAIRSDEPRHASVCPSHAQPIVDRMAQCPDCLKELQRRPLNEDERVVWWCPTHSRLASDGSAAACDQCSDMRLVPKLLLLAKPGEVLAVPERSVIDTGSKKIVYVERDPGTFDAVEVELGPRTGGFYPVVRGLEPGDHVAAAGAFLIDAETRLDPNAAASYVGAGPSAQTVRKTPVHNRRKEMERSKGADRASNFENVQQLLEPDRILAMAQVTCPISEQPLGSMGVPHKIIVKGQTVFLCCAGCTPDVNHDPDKVLRRLAESKK